jgi:hypothetical protein
MYAKLGPQNTISIPIPVPGCHRKLLIRRLCFEKSMCRTIVHVDSSQRAMFLSARIFSIIFSCSSSSSAFFWSHAPSPLVHLTYLVTRAPHPLDSFCSDATIPCSFPAQYSGLSGHILVASTIPIKPVSSSSFSILLLKIQNVSLVQICSPDHLDC